MGEMGKMSEIRVNKGKRDHKKKRKLREKGRKEGIKEKSYINRGDYNKYMLNRSSS